MRSAVVLLVLFFSFSSVFALYDEPPIANVTAHNLALATSLDDSFSQVKAVNGTITMLFNTSGPNGTSSSFNLPLLHASAALVSIDPSIDNATIASGAPVLLLARGAYAAPLAPSDYDNDGCVESQLSSSVSPSALATFSFGDVSETVPVSGNLVQVPERVLAAMGNSTGVDVLQVRLNATFDFTYDVDDPIEVAGTCTDNIVSFHSPLHVSDARNWSVEGNRTLYFLLEPVLGEQWFRDNRFDSVVFSDSLIYAGSISGPGNQSYAFRIYGFDITNDSYGAWHAVSVELPSGHDGIAGYYAQNTPTALEHDSATYSYVYDFNYSYQGIGENVLTLEVQLLSGANRTFQERLLSRALTYSGNITELGTPAEPSISRPSLGFSADTIGEASLGLGLAGLLLVVILLNSVRGKRG